MSRPGHRRWSTNVGANAARTVRPAGWVANRACRPPDHRFDNQRVLAIDTGTAQHYLKNISKQLKVPLAEQEQHRWPVAAILLVPMLERQRSHKQRSTPLTARNQIEHASSPKFLPVRKSSQSFGSLPKKSRPAAFNGRLTSACLRANATEFSP